MKKLKVLFVTSEIAPWVKTGGLGDVCGALPQALRELGVDVRLLVPYYPALAQAFPSAKRVAEVSDLGGQLPAVTLRQATTASGLPLLLLDCPPLFMRPGNPYLDADGSDWPDNAIRYGLLSRVAALLGSDANPLPWQAQLIHCHDWQTALAPAYLKYLGGTHSARAATLITVHNLAFQGLFGATLLAELGLPPQAWQIDGVEYYGHLSFLKAGLQHADWITSVSPTYASEIQTDAEGMGLAGLLRWRSERLSGILNGIDDDLWNPATDPHLPAHYVAGNLQGKAANKLALQRRMGLAENASMPLLGVVSRLTEQKGLDLLPPLAAEIAALPAQLAVLGSGSRELEDAFRNMAQTHPGQFATQIGFDEGLAHLIEAGADMFLMPSRFEPCGLNQMYSLRYGTPPIVRRTGGLADSVIDCIPATLASGTANGFAFAAPTEDALLTAIERAVLAWREPAIWRQLQHNGMNRDWSWQVPAQQYADLYRRLAAG
ncbi:MAG: glycogen synthase GlgA [Sterolibacterium sp.]